MAWPSRAQSNETVPFITVSEVRVRADDTFGIDPTEAVLAMCSVQKGFRAAQIDVQKAISADVKALLATPMYARVDAAIGMDDQEQWVVTYTISRRPQLASDPAIDGIDGVIRLSKAEKEVKLKRNDRIDESIAAAAAGRLRAELEDRGYVDAKVTFTGSRSSLPETSTTWTSKRQRSMCRKKSCPKPAPSAAPSMMPGMSAITKDTPSST